jgi:hypothetical protein
MFEDTRLSRDDEEFVRIRDVAEILAEVVS